MREWIWDDFRFYNDSCEFFLLGGQVEANYQLKLVDNRHGVSSVADGWEYGTVGEIKSAKVGMGG